MMHFIWFCASGDSFFLGVSLTILAVALTSFEARPYVTIAARTLLVIGFLLVLMAAVSLPSILYGVWAVAIASLLITANMVKPVRFRQGAQAAVLTLAVVALLMELHFQMSVDPPRGEPIYVIGDSVSAGIQGPDEITWPTLLAEQYDIDVVNLAQAGATVHSARKQAGQLPDRPGVVLLEIGGNDLFGPTPPPQFEKDLIYLLQQIVHPDRIVVMLELPVLPWQVRYNRIQRSVAKSFGVTLVPKRFFTSVLRQRGATLDLAHLTTKGHQEMAGQMALLFGLAKSRPQQDGM